MKHGLLVVLTLAFLLSGCAHQPAVDTTRNWSAQRLYGQAMDEIQATNYGKAIKLLEDIEARYPYGRYAQQAQLEVAYAYYKDGEPTSAVDACERFIKLHPKNPDADYAYYLKGLSNFVADQTVFSRISAQDVSERDPKPLIASFDSFRELTTKYPNSRYTSDALERMKYLANLLAEHEVHIALYYYDRKAWVAAIDRSQDALTRFPQSPTNELSLAIMTRAYNAVGAPDLAADSLSVLKLNFPKSVYLNPKTALVLRGATLPKKSWWKIWAT